MEPHPPAAHGRPLVAGGVMAHTLGVGVLNVCLLFRRCLTKAMNAIVEIQTQRPVSLELYKDYKELGRFMLRYGGSTIAAGVVTEVRTRCVNTTSDAHSLVPC